MYKTRTLSLSLLPLVFAALLTPGPGCARDNALTHREKTRGWKLLFDGKALDGWAAFGKSDAWVIADGAISCSGKGGGLLRTTEQYGDFILSVDFKLTEGANSGVFVHWSDLSNWLHKSVEIQILDTAGKHKPDRHDCGAIYDYLAPATNACKPSGEWNRMVITCKGSMITVVHNDTKICELDRDQWSVAHQNPDGTQNKFNYALKDLPRRGYIALQDHGGQVWFRNIKVRPLSNK